MANDAPALLSYDDATARLLSPGSPFELTEEVVLGETMSVYKNRARSLREILERSAAHGDKEYIVHGDRRITYAEQQLVCLLDTGANRTVFYEPFFRRNRQLVQSMGEAGYANTAGAGGVRRIAVYSILKFEVGVADVRVTLADLDVFTEALSQDETESFLDCKLGQDLLDQFDETIINFRSMSLLLR